MPGRHFPEAAFEKKHGRACKNTAGWLSGEGWRARQREGRVTALPQKQTGGWGREWSGSMQAALLEGLAEECQSQLSNWTLLLCGTQAEAGRGRQGPVGRPCSSGKVGWWLATAEKIKVVLISTVSLLEAGLPIPLCPLTHMSKHRSSHSYTPTLVPTHPKSPPSLSHNLLPVQQTKSNPNAFQHGDLEMTLGKLFYPI